MVQVGLQHTSELVNQGLGGGLLILAGSRARRTMTTIGNYRDCTTILRDNG